MSSFPPFIQIDDVTKAHILENTGTILVGTRDASLTPEITRGWGPTIRPDGHTIDVCISLSAGAKTLENLRDSDEIAVTFCHTSSYRTLQLKGRFLGSGEPTPQDSKAVERQRNTFIEQTKVHSIRPNVVSRLFTTDLVSIRLLVQQAFEQTPGPRAGSTL